MAKPLAFGTHVYTSMRDCANECRERIIKYSTGDTLNTDDFEYFTQLFTLHPEHRRKKGVGIKAIKYDNDGYGNNCLWIERHDGSKEDISWRKCVRPHTHDEVIEMAFKRAVTGNIAKVGVKDNNVITYRAGFKFNKLIKRFLDNNRTNYKLIKVINPPENGDPRPLLADHWLAAEWCVFHEENVKLLA